MTTNILLRLLLLIFILLLTSCSVGPDYKKPKMQVPDNFAVKAEIINSADVNVLWWQEFNDETLNNLINEAVASNRNIKQALFRVNQARALADEKFTELLPGLSVDTNYNKTQISGVRFGGNSIKYELYHSTLDVAWEIDLFGRLRRNLEASNAAYAQIVADLNGTVLSLISNLAGTYFELRANQKRLNIAKKNLEAQAKTIELAQVQYDAGETTSLDLERSKVPYYQTSAKIPALESLVESNIHQISVLCGKLPEHYRKELLPTENLPQYTGTLAAGNIKDILLRRPDIQSAEKNLASYTALIGVETGLLFPKLTLTGYIGYENSRLNSLLKSPSEIYNYGPQISWTPFDTGRIRARIRAAEANADAALYNYEQTVLTALQELATSFSSLNSEARQTNDLTNAFQAANKAYDLAKIQYQAGAIDLLSVLDAQNAMLNTEDQLAINELNYLVSIVNVYKALGGGWENWELVEEK